MDKESVQSVIAHELGHIKVMMFGINWEQHPVANY